MSSEAKNLEAISAAIDQHNRNCPYPAAEVRMNPYEVERLGWDEVRGLPVVPDPAIGTGRFRIVCSRDGEGARAGRALTAQTSAKKFSPTLSSAFCASMLSWKSSSV